MTGKIQFGVASAAIAQVIVPALAFSPEGATGTDPMPPGTVTLLELWPMPLPLLEPSLLQAAKAIMLAIARVSPAAILLRNFVGHPSMRHSRVRSALRPSG